MSVPNNWQHIVYHYCNLETFLSIISNSTFRLSNISKSNDCEEIRYILPQMEYVCTDLFQKYNKKLPEAYQISIDSIAELFKLVFNDFAFTFYVACFSESKDLLSQWRGYADDGQGVAIGINTYTFLPITQDRLSNFSFEQVKYTFDDMKTAVVDILSIELEDKWVNACPEENISILTNVFNKTLAMLLQKAVIYKNPAFCEEREWRLVYNPFGRIRRVTTIQDYLDRMHESFNTCRRDGGFVQNGISFRASKNRIISYMDLDFSQIKKDLIQEIVIGPKADINDNDLRMFLSLNGYDVEYYGSKKKHVKIYTSNSSYR